MQTKKYHHRFLIIPTGIKRVETKITDVIYRDGGLVACERLVGKTKGIIGKFVEGKGRKGRGSCSFLYFSSTEPDRSPHPLFHFNSTILFLLSSPSAIVRIITLKFLDYNIFYIKSNIHFILSFHDFWFIYDS